MFVQSVPFSLGGRGGASTAPTPWKGAHGITWSWGHSPGVTHRRVGVWVRRGAGSSPRVTGRRDRSARRETRVLEFPSSVWYSDLRDRAVGSHGSHGSGG